MTESLNISLSTRANENKQMLIEKRFIDQSNAETLSKLKREPRRQQTSDDHDELKSKTNRKMNETMKTAQKHESQDKIECIRLNVSSISFRNKKVSESSILHHSSIKSISNKKHLTVIESYMECSAYIVKPLVTWV